MTKPVKQNRKARTPKKELKFIDPKLLKGWHRVFYRATQVERSAPCYLGGLKQGMRVGVLEEREEFTGNIPSTTFYTGVVEKIDEYASGEDPLVTIKYDGHPYAVSLVVGKKFIEKFCIKIPVQR